MTSSLSRSSPMRRTPSKRTRARMAEWTETVRDRKAKVGNVCEMGGNCCGRLEGHHVQARRSGDDTYDNCRILCKEHHAFIHSQVAWSIANRWIVPTNSVGMEVAGE